MYNITYSYGRERSRFGRQCLFSDRNHLMLNISPSYHQRLNYILRNPVDMATQLSDTKALSMAQTETVTFSDHGMFHCEGGWPRDININDEEQTLRHRKKVERDESWGIQVSSLIRNAMVVADQNSAVNIFQDFMFVDALGEMHSRFEARTAHIYHDPVRPCRRVSFINWHPNDTMRCLVQHTYEKDGRDNFEQIFDTHVENFGTVNSFHIWDVKNPLKPIKMLNATDPVWRAMYCPKDEDYVAGGMDTGKVGVWDTRRSTELPLQVCPLEAAHREAVSALCWVHSKSNSEFYTGSLDGSVKYWDGRDLKNCLQELFLDPERTDEQSRDRAQGVTVLEFEYTIPVRYVLASDQGYIFIGNRKGATPTEIFTANYQLFAGPIRTIERNPFFVKNFLICGDWCAKIWSEECKGSPTTLLVKRLYQVLCGTWSPTRCSMFVTGDANGNVDFWDLLLHHREPIFTLKFSCAVTSVKFRTDGEFLAVGFDNGDIHMLELDEAIKKSGSKDKGLMAALFEREMLRAKLLEGRVEEFKLKRKTSAWEAEQVAEVDPMDELDPDDPEQFLLIIENDLVFKEALKAFKDITLKIDRKRSERAIIWEKTAFDIYDEEQAAAEEENSQIEPTT